MIKLCVGVTQVAELRDWVDDCKAGKDTLDHVTRMAPSRAEEILAGGSLYWVIKGLICCRQPIAGFETVQSHDGIKRCRIMFKPEIIPVALTPRRAFQGWRYLTDADAPNDADAKHNRGEANEKLRRELAALGLI